MATTEDQHEAYEGLYFELKTAKVALSRSIELLLAPSIKNGKNTRWMRKKVDLAIQDTCDAENAAYHELCVTKQKLERRRSDAGKEDAR